MTLSQIGCIFSRKKKNIIIKKTLKVTEKIIIGNVEDYLIGKQLILLESKVIGSKLLHPCIGVENSKWTKCSTTKKYFQLGLQKEGDFMIQLK